MSDDNDEWVPAITMKASCERCGDRGVVTAECEDEAGPVLLFCSCPSAEVARTRIETAPEFAALRAQREAVERLLAEMPAPTMVPTSYVSNTRAVRRAVKECIAAYNAGQIEAGRDPVEFRRAAHGAATMVLVERGAKIARVTEWIEMPCDERSVACAARHLLLRHLLHGRPSGRIWTLGDPVHVIRDDGVSERYIDPTIATDDDYLVCRLRTIFYRESDAS